MTVFLLSVIVPVQFLTVFLYYQDNIDLFCFLPYNYYTSKRKITAHIISFQHRKDWRAVFGLSGGESF